MKKICIFIISFLFIQGVFAQTPIDVYKTFGEYSGGGNLILSELQSDGKLITTGLGNYNNNLEKTLIRFNTDGSKDKSFNIGSGFTGAVNATEGYISSFVIQPNDKIIVAGEFTNFNGSAQKRLVRLNSDGSKDVTFNIGTGVVITSPSNSNWGKIFLQPDGKILLAGSIASYNGLTQSNIQSGSALIRLNSDGSKDNSFNVNSGFYDSLLPNTSCLVSSVVFQPDGKIIVGGSFTSYQGVTKNRLIRLNTDGSIDSTFDIGIGFNSYVFDIALQTDGKILVGGKFTTFNGLVQNHLIRLNTDGSKDNTFDIGTGFGNFVNNISIQNNGEIIVSGSFTSFNGVSQNKLIKLFSNGLKDDSFNIGSGFVDTSVSNFLYINKQQDNKIICYGNFTKYNEVCQNGFVRINLDGTKDDTFLLGQPGFNNGISPGTTGAAPGVYSLCLQPDGKLLVGGSFTFYNGIIENKLIRFNSDGKKDTSFNIRNPSVTYLPSTGFDTGKVYTIAVQPDGKILVGGDFTTFNNVSQNRIIRLNTDGTKDITFNIGTGFNSGVVGQILIQPDGKILALGSFTSYNGVSKKKLIRLNQDGSIDNSLINFTTQDFNTIALQADGKIIVGGYSGSLARLNPDGTNDTFFSVGSGLNASVNKISIQQDNKILVGGSFTTYNGLTQKGLIRFNIDGSKDTTFNVGGIGIGDVTDGGVYDIATQSDGKIIICGGIKDYNGVIQYGLIRLMINGSIDSSFIFGDSANSYAFNTWPSFPYSIAISNNGTILVGGGFRNYFNYASSGLVGIRGNAVLSNENFEITNNEITLFPNPVDNVLNFKISNFSNVSKVSIYDLIGNQILNDKNVINDNIDISNLSNGIYLIKMTTTNDEIITKKIIKK